MPAPMGSSTVFWKPPSTNLLGMPSTVSEPNHVAKVVAMITGNGSDTADAGGGDAAAPEAQP